MKWIFLLLLLTPVVAAQTIADYPSIFFSNNNFNGYLIKGDLTSPQEIIASDMVVNLATGMQSSFYSPYSVITNIRLASQVSILDRPAIIVGTPCNNEWVRKILNVYNCNVIPGYQGHIILTRYNNQLVLLITGGSPYALLEAANWLHSNNHFRFFGTRARISRGYQIGNGDLLSVGREIGDISNAITTQYPLQTTNVRTYLRFPGGRVIFGERD